METNLIGFDVTLGRKKPRTLLKKDDECPFCRREKLTDIIETDGNIIFLRNKYNVIKGADQFVLIESDICDGDMPGYSKEHMRRLIRFGIKEWRQMIDSKKYRAVLFFKNYGPLSGGTIRHPHMQIVGFRKLNSALLFNPEEFAGLKVADKNGVALNVSTFPRVGFSEINIIPEKNADIDTVADFIQISVDYIMKHFNVNCKSYNIFFYQNDKGGAADFYVKVMPRFATSPLFIGYNIRFLSSNIETVAEDMKKIYADRLK